MITPLSDQDVLHYVWLAYGISGLLLTALLLTSWRCYRRAHTRHTQLKQALSQE